LTDLTRQQSRTLTFVRDYAAANGYSPTLREIGQHIAASTVSVHTLVTALVGRGKLHRLPNKARGLVVIEPRQVELNPEIFNLIATYANDSHTTIETAANQLLRDALGAA
jgi:SOS-response transcriptional repressor LexA